MNPRRRHTLGTAACVLASALVPCPGAWAQQVAMSGSMGSNRALLVIDGQAQVLAVGQTARGVTLKRLEDGQAWVQVAGQERLLRLGQSPTRVDEPGAGAGQAAGPTAGARSIVLPMGPGGHFSTLGMINGRSVRFLVDTGATTVALSQAEANRIGLDWRGGQAMMSQTANGTVPVRAVTLDSVRVGEVELANVAAVVVPSEMPMVLLGNSFLSRFTMQRSGDVMRLDKKP